MKRSWIILALTTFIVSGLTVPVLGQQSPGLKALVEGARKEGRLDVMFPSSMSEKGARELSAAFNKRFGLNVQVNADLAGQESQKFNQAVVETKTGIPPTFDLMQGENDNQIMLWDVGGAEPVENWDALLGEVAPEAHKVRQKVSPLILAGYGFLWSTRTTALLYNPKIISDKELPRTWKEMGEVKYRGAFSVPPWIGPALMGIVKYDREEWLEVVRSWGRNKPQILTFRAGVERMLLGDLKFLYGNAGIYFEEKAKDPNAPIGLRFFDDLTTVRQVMYVVRKGARNPNAAKLFALWVTGTEANAIISKHSPDVENVVLGRGYATEMMLKIFRDRKIEPVSWFDTIETLQKFRWFETQGGKDYSRAIARAQREGK